MLFAESQNFYVFEDLSRHPWIYFSELSL